MTEQNPQPMAISHSLREGFFKAARILNVNPNFAELADHIFQGKAIFERAALQGWYASIHEIGKNKAEVDLAYDLLALERNNIEAATEFLCKRLGSNSGYPSPLLKRALVTYSQ